MGKNAALPGRSIPSLPSPPQGAIDLIANSPYRPFIMSDNRIPKAPLILGLSGLIPFAIGAASHLNPSFALGELMVLFDPEFSGAVLLKYYGATILAFMSGIIWGFATRSPATTAGIGYALSVLPALWAALTLFLPADLACMGLSLGFAALMLLDMRAASLIEAPEWWISLRVMLTIGAISALLVGAFA